LAPSNKVRRIAKADGSKGYFEYDATANITKKVFTDVSGFDSKVTHCVRDAQGNPISTY